MKMDDKHTYTNLVTAGSLEVADDKFKAIGMCVVEIVHMNGLLVTQSPSYSFCLPHCID
jgi:hypothetical protein